MSILLNNAISAVGVCGYANACASISAFTMAA
jgi:hypothetical protein